MTAKANLTHPDLAAGGFVSTLRLVAKRSIQRCFWLIVSPSLLRYWLARLLLGSRAFGASSEAIARIPGLWGVFSRQAFYRFTLAHCGQDVYFGWNSAFSMTEARVGDRVYIGRFCSLGFADIEREVMLADGVQILSGGREHSRVDPGAPMQSQPQAYQRVRIGRNSWIGAGAVIMADIGENCIIGAGAVVNKPIPPFTVAVGVPARVVKSLSEHGNAENTKRIILP